MYGMVNEGVREFIETHHGQETWKTICTRAGIAVESFERMESYDDKITYDLVMAIADHTQLSATKVLNVFGTHWIDYAGRSAFGELMRFAGNSFLERLDGLDDMHARIKLSMPHLQPPSFELEEVGPDTYHLHYYSDREGLEPMVIGLLHGLADETGAAIKVNQVAQKSVGTDHSVFQILLENHDGVVDLS